MPQNDDTTTTHEPHDDVRDLAFGHVEQRTEFVTESGESLTDAVADRLDE